MSADVRPIRGNEPWCSTKLLGSLMCSVKDIDRRCVLGNVAFNSFSKVRLSSKITLENKLKVYQAQVVSVIMYNASCWAAPKHVFEKLDACNRKHHRKIMNIKWPSSMISNKTLYARCRTKPLSSIAEAARWKMLGHVLRSDESSPVHAYLCFAVDIMGVLSGRIERHRINIFKVLQNDNAVSLSLVMGILFIFETLHIIENNRESNSIHKKYIIKVLNYI